MNWRRVLGAVLVSLPFVVIFAVTAAQYGVLHALAFFGAVILIAGLVIVGVELAVNS